jgi:hypothetical protein
MSWFGALPLAAAPAAGSVNVGTSFRLAPNSEPVESLIVLHPESGMDVSTVTVRLPRQQARLAPAIIAAWRGL